LTRPRFRVYHLSMLQRLIELLLRILAAVLRGLLRRTNAVQIVFESGGLTLDTLIVEVGQTKRVQAHLLKTDQSEDTSFENPQYSAGDPPSTAFSFEADPANPLIVSVTGISATPADATDEQLPKVALSVDVAGSDEPAARVVLLNNSFGVRVVPANAKVIEFEELPATP
jgi:hypothetical protein